MIAAIKPKFTASVSQEIASAFHVFNPLVGPGIFNESNLQPSSIALLLILMATVCVVGDFARAISKRITSTQTIS